jgi:hypothetical protein
MARIILSLNGNVLREVALAKERIAIGRGPGNDIVLDNLAVSAEHAVIVTHDDDSFLEDLNSTNGTQVNGQPIKKHFLQDEDVIEIAQYRVRYRAQSQDLLHQSGGTAMNAWIRVIEGMGAGKEIPLVKALTTIGQPSVQTAAIARRDQKYYLLHLEGGMPPIVNGHLLASGSQEMVHGDMISIAGTCLRFLTTRP